MRYRSLGKSGIKISALGLGCMGMTHAYGAPSDEHEMIELIRSAADMGITFFDTAECYTADDGQGRVLYNETLVGKALKECRGSVVIATKFGVHHNSDSTLSTDSRPETIRKSVEGSLKRLGTDHIDLYYQHRIDPKITPEETAGVMRELIKEGKIRAWGVSEAGEEYIRRADAVCHISAVQNRYSMMYRSYDSLILVLSELGITFVAHSPLANGFLSGKYNNNPKFNGQNDYRSTMPQFRPESIAKNRELLGMLNALAERRNATPAQIALSWMMAKGIVPIPGTRKAERLKENAGAADVELSAVEAAGIDVILSGMEMSEVFGGHKAS